MMRRVRRPSSPALAVQPGAQFCQIDLCHCNAVAPVTPACAAPLVPNFTNVPA